MTPGRRIPTGRTWRDLPPSPPSSFVPAPSFAEPEVPPAARRPRILPFVFGGLLIVLVGFVVGLMLPSGLLSDEEAVDTSSLPEVIIPPPPSFPEDQPQPTVPASETLFSLPDPPAGFQVRSNVARSSPDRVEQRMILSDANDEVVIFGSSSADTLDLPNGERVTVRGVDGVLTGTAGAPFTVTWVEPGKILMSITAPDSFDVSRMLALADSLEIP
jgi:hypothetical protein